MWKKKNKRPHIIVVMPAYNAAATLEKTYRDLPKTISEVIVVDDNSSDDTVAIARRLGLTVYSHDQNRGYGANQKTCYRQALIKKPDVVIMVHPDYQYDATLVEDLVKPILDGRFDMMFGSRIRTRKEVLDGGMPPVKYFLNRIFCVIENLVLGTNFTEYFSGMRAYSNKLLKSICFERFSDDFVFDQQMMIVAYAAGFRIGEINIPVRYFSESSSIHFFKGAKFLLGTIAVLARYMVHRAKIIKDPLFTINKVTH